MERTVLTANQPSQAQAISHVIFTVDRATGKIISVYPAVNSDEQLAEVDRWISACLVLSDLIRPAKTDTRAAA